jgi:hypothetical protein
MGPLLIPAMPVSTGSPGQAGRRQEGVVEPTAVGSFEKPAKNPALSGVFPFVQRKIRTVGSGRSAS